MFIKKCHKIVNKHSPVIFAGNMRRSLLWLETPSATFPYIIKTIPQHALTSKVGQRLILCFDENSNCVAMIIKPRKHHLASSSMCGCPLQSNVHLLAPSSFAVGVFLLHGRRKQAIAHTWPNMPQDIFDYGESKFDVYFTIQLAHNFVFVAGKVYSDVSNVLK